jgi:prophage maintenance system killer protein
MMKLNQKQQNILAIILEKGRLQSSEVHEELTKRGEDISLVSVKRALSDMARAGALTSIGLGRNTGYEISTIGRVFADISEKAYTSVEPDSRFGSDRYNFDLFPEFPAEIFDESELSDLDKATEGYRQKSKNLSKVLADKELQRFVIELSWKSSKIEGNTYTLLDTERLLNEGIEATGHAKDEAKMILNHKDAFLFIRENEAEFKSLSLRNLEDLHAILIKDLDVIKGIRKGLVGITGSKYRPLDNVHQIKEAIESLGEAISRAKTPYDKALLALVGISYIQPFEDGNKRTGRLMANALLLSHGYAPLSYRSVNEDDFKGSMLVFYETNSVISIKRIFKEQYIFAAEHYAVK